MKPGDSYHHGDLKAELIRLGVLAIESEGEEELSLRRLAERAGVSKTAPYRHFADKEAFLGALIDEGNRILHGELTRAAESGGASVAGMGRAYMTFAAAHPALYRLMNSPRVCRLPDELMVWARKSLLLLGESLAAATGEARPSPDAAAAVWGYIHGLVLLRIDALFPAFAGEPDWERLSGEIPIIGRG